MKLLVNRPTRSRIAAVNRPSRSFAAAGTSALMVSSLLALGLLPSSARAQAVQPVAPPQITVSARGEVQVTPDRARVQVGVETQSKTAAVAANDNNKKQAAILAAIKALGVPASAITTQGYNVYPVQRYDDKLQRTVIDGYRVSNIVQVETDKLEQAGPIIDAALTNGANRVNSLDFMVKDPSAARDEALTKAVQSAKRQAMAAAAAAGGQVVELLEMNINDYDQPTPRPMMAMRAKADEASMTPTPISEGTTTVSITINTRWRFIGK